MVHWDNYEVMPSVSIQLPLAIILLCGALVATFAGYRLLRAFLAIYGFIGGVLISTLFVDQFDTWLEIATSAAAGIAGAAIAVAIYLAGVAIFGAGMAAFMLNLSVEGDPDIWILIGACLAGALVSLMARKYILIVGTAFVGSWMAVVAGMALLQKDIAITAIMSGDASQLFPMAPLEDQVMFSVCWAALGLAGSLMQLSRMSRVGLVRKKAKAKEK
tara:strand:- start:348 stop:998 length:651 start_codon:yes stop_codon:yes gene_type:complete